MPSAGILCTLLDGRMAGFAWEGVKVAEIGGNNIFRPLGIIMITVTMSIHVTKQGG